MITEVPKEKLVEVGKRTMSGPLVEQAGYTLGIAALDGEGVSRNLPGGFRGEVEGELAKVVEARHDKELLKTESMEATKTQNSAFKQSKVWRRTVSKLAVNAVEMGKSMPDGLLRIYKARTMPEIQTQMSEMVRLLGENVAEIPGKDAADLLRQGKELEKALQTADAEQEVKRFRELPEKVIDFNWHKGLLYTGLKIINNAGHALYADDAFGSSKYNMDILHRRGVKRQPAQEKAVS